MKKLQLSRLSVCYFCCAVTLSFLQQFVFSFLSSFISSRSAVLAQMAVLLLAAILGAAAIGSFFRFARQDGLRKGLAVAAFFLLFLAIINEIAFKGLFQPNGSVAYKTAFYAMITLFSIQTPLTLMAIQYAEVISKKKLAVAIALLYVLSLLCSIVMQGYSFWLIECISLSQWVPSAQYTINGIGWLVVRLLSFAVAILQAVSAVLFLRLIRAVEQPSSAGWAGQPQQAAGIAGSDAPLRPGVCPNCGRDNGPEANFCAVCAIPLKRPGPQSSPEGSGSGRRCPSCGVPLEPGDHYCPLCGSKAEESISDVRH